MKKQQQQQIARLWHGVVPTEQAEAYVQYLQQTGLKDYQKIDGNLGVRVLRRTVGAKTHFILLTFWDSYDSIRAFAGKDYKRARYYSKDQNYLLELEPYVSHYEVL